MRYYILLPLCIITSFLRADITNKNDDSNAQKPTGKLMKKLMEESNNCVRMELRFDDYLFGNSRKKLDIQEEHQIRILEILKGVKYRAPVLASSRFSGHTERIMYIKMYLKNDDFSYLTLEKNGDIPINVNFDIPEKNKEEFRALLKPYIEKLVPPEILKDYTLAPLTEERFNEEQAKKCGKCEESSE